MVNKFQNKIVHKRWKCPRSIGRRSGIAKNYTARVEVSSREDNNNVGV